MTIDFVSIESKCVIRNISNHSVTVSGVNISPSQSVDLFKACTDLSELDIIDGLRRPNGELYILAEKKKVIAIDQLELVHSAGNTVVNNINTTVTNLMEQGAGLDTTNNPFEGALLTAGVGGLTLSWALPSDSGAVASLSWTANGVNWKNLNLTIQPNTMFSIDGVVHAYNNEGDVFNGFFMAVGDNIQYDWDSWLDNYYGDYDDFDLDSSEDNMNLFFYIIRPPTDNGNQSTANIQFTDFSDITDGDTFTITQPNLSLGQPGGTMTFEFDSDNSVSGGNKSIDITDLASDLSNLYIRIANRVNQEANGLLVNAYFSGGSTVLYNYGTNSAQNNIPITGNFVSPNAMLTGFSGGTDDLSPTWHYNIKYRLTTNNGTTVTPELVDANDD